MGWSCYGHQIVGAVWHQFQSGGFPGGVPSLTGIALSTATMFSAVNSPTPRVVFDMVVSGAAGVRLLRVGGCAQGGAVVLWGLWCAKLVSNVLWRAVWLGELSCYGSKKGGSFEPPIVGRFALASVISTRRKLRDKADYRAANGRGK